MPESSKISLLELSARYALNPETLTQRFPYQDHFLLILPFEDSPPPVVWTSSNPLIKDGSTSIIKLTYHTALKVYAVPGAIIVPITKSKRNSKPSIIVGRDDLTDIRLSSKQVSRFHLELSIKNKKLEIKDLNTTNGTYINGMIFQSKEPFALESLTEITFGDVRTLYLNSKDLTELLKLTPGHFE